MLLSIIIPVYNVAQYLDECLQSVVSQSYRHLEIILVDDGSTDRSGLLCDEWAGRDSRIRVLHKTNGGLSDARNHGLQAATGDYVLFLDSDDYYLCNTGLQQMVDALHACEVELLLFKRVDVYDTYQHLSPDYDSAFLTTHTAEEAFRHLVLTQRFNMSACFQIIKRELLLSYQLFFPVGMLSEDVDWSLRLWQCVNSVGVLNLNMYAYRHRSGSITTTYALRNLMCYDQMFTHWKSQTDLRNREVVRAYLANLYVSCMYNYYAISSSDRPQALRILHRHADLLQYALSPKAKRAQWVNRLFPIGLTIRLFAFYGWMKHR